MGQAQRDYWCECVAQSCEEHGVPITPEQLAAVARDVELAHEHYGMAFYSPPAYENYDRELRETKAELKKEREKVFCRECYGRGRLYIQGPYHGSDSQCWKCHGEGKHAP